MSSEHGDSAFPAFSMHSESSHLYQPFNSRENRSQKLQEILNLGVASSTSRHVVSSSHRKPWPSRKVSQAEDAIKYSSDVSSHLRGEEYGNGMQEAAINLGVLEWRRLQKWAGQEEASSLFSPVHPFLRSPRNGVLSPVGRKQSPSLDASPLRSNQPNGNIKDSSICIIKSRPANTSSSSSKVKPGASPSVEVEKLTNPKHESCRVHLHLNRNEPKSQQMVSKSNRSQLEEDIREGRLSFDAALLNDWVPTKTSCGSLSGGDEDKTDKFHDANGKSAFERGKDLLPMILSRVDSKRMSSSPPKGASFAGNPNMAVSRSNSMGRRSPLRQMIEPPRLSSSSIASFTDHPDVVVSRSRRSPAKNKFETPRRSTLAGGRSNSRGRRSPVKQTAEEAPCANARQSQSSSKQALLKLSWKNGLPLLMFSSSDDNILVATMHKRGSSDMNICDCVYVIHTAVAVEVKKKNGAWLSQGARSRKPEFASKFVAELVVSSSERVSFDLSHRSTLREFVLLGGELTPTNLVDAIPLSSAELAAIMVESSHQKSGSSSCGVLCACKLCVPRIVAILPSGVHGFSDAKEPSSLIERWESGGSCDCGGWDEGCMLTILTNNSQSMKKSRSTQGHQSVDGTGGFNLFTEGDARKGKRSFSMVAFKEDMFTVEFRPSFPLLQAFAISIAMLHGRNAGDGGMRNCSVEDSSSDDLSFDDFPLVSSS